MQKMDASEVAVLLNEFGRRVMLYGGNPYRAKAYLRAAEHVALLTEPIEKEFFKSIGSHRVTKEMISLASHILDTKAGHFDPAKFKDEYELALRKLVKRKAAGKTIEAAEEKEDRSNVIDLMEALRQSVKGKEMAAAALRTNSRSRKTKSRARTRGKRKAA